MCISQVVELIGGCGLGTDGRLSNSTWTFTPGCTSWIRGRLCCTYCDGTLHQLRLSTFGFWQFRRWGSLHRDPMQSCQDSCLAEKAIQVGSLPYGESLGHFGQIRRRPRLKGFLHAAEMPLKLTSLVHEFCIYLCTIVSFSGWSSRVARNLEWVGAIERDPTIFDLHFSLAERFIDLFCTRSCMTRNSFPKFRQNFTVLELFLFGWVEGCQSGLESLTF